MARTDLKEVPQIADDLGLWEDVDAILRPVMVREFSKAYRLGYIVAVLEMDAILKDFQDDVIARADAMLSADIAAELGILGEDIDLGGIEVADWTELNSFVESSFYSNWWSKWSQAEITRTRDVVNRANQEGLSTRETAKLLEGTFGRARASVIAATEMTNIMGAANQAAYRQAGFGEWSWRTAADRRVDPICEGLDGETFPMSVQFSSAHPRCRCWPVPVADSISARKPVGQTDPRPTIGDPDDVYPPGFPDDRKRRGTPFPEGGFKTAKAGENWFRERYPWIEPTLSRMDVNVLNDQLRAFDLLSGRFPSVSARMTQMGTKALSLGWSRNTYAHANRGGNGIGLNPTWHNKTGKYGRDGGYQRQIERDSTVPTGVDPTRIEALPFHPRGAGLTGGVMVHEFGHLVDGFLEGHVAFRTGKSRFKLQFHKNPFPGMNEDTWIRIVHENRVAQRPSTLPSQYAAKNRQEAYAEAFSQWFASDQNLPGSLPLSQLSPHARAIGRFMEEFPPETWTPEAMTRGRTGIPDRIARLDEELKELMSE
jgi:SPP1 gp7 family putative phage head morphogenesis protein